MDLLTKIILRAETVPVVSKNHTIILAPPMGRVPNMDIAPMTETALATKKEGGKVNPCYRAYRRATPAMEDTGTQVERWAMPTWCHMFNSTLIGTARVWFDELLLENIDGYKDLKAAFSADFMQQKKYIKDPVEIHNIKQRDGETIEDFMERFKVETGRMKGAPEWMQISGFMHGVNNPELTKCLNEHVPKTMEEMMIATTAFIRGETDVAGKKKAHPSWRAHDQSKRHASETQHGRVYAVKKAYQRIGASRHLIKEIKQGKDQPKAGKKEVPAKDKSMVIYMVQPWHRMTRQKVTQSFEHVSDITFPSLTTSSGTEGPLVIEAEIGGHMIHRMCVDGGSSTRRRSFYKSMDEFHDRKVIITVQRYHWETWNKRNLSSTIHNPWNA
ncbi:reverse transcriptase domain-containing protein [Tanacetum coccineum]